MGKKQTAEPRIDPMDQWASDMDDEAFAQVLAEVNRIVEKKTGEYLLNQLPIPFTKPLRRMRALRSMRGRLLEVVAMDPSRASSVFEALVEVRDRVPEFRNDALSILERFAYRPNEHQKVALKVLETRSLAAREMLKALQKAETDVIEQGNT